MKKLSLKNILLEIENPQQDLTGARKRIPGRKMAQFAGPASTPQDIQFDPTVKAQPRNDWQRQEQEQDLVDKQDQMTPKPELYTDLRNQMTQFQQPDGSYLIPNNFADQLIKQFGSLQDARIEIFGANPDERTSIKVVGTPKQNIPQVNQQAQQFRKQNPIQNKSDLSPEEESEVSQFGTGTKQKRGLPQTSKEMAERYKQAMFQAQNGKPLEVWDPKTNQYIIPNK